jgi:DNA-binding response OmpR family regulator
MADDRSPEICEVSRAELLYGRPVVERQRWTVKDDDPVDPWSYRMKIGRGTVWLNAVEYRIFCLLAGKPYRAFSRDRIAAAVSTERHPVTPQSLGRHIASLRAKLGFFADYIQSVPYIGYRFKA